MATGGEAHSKYPIQERGDQYEANKRLLLELKTAMEMELEKPEYKAVRLKSDVRKKGNTLLDLLKLTDRWIAESTVDNQTIKGEKMDYDATTLIKRIEKVLDLGTQTPNSKNPRSEQKEVNFYGNVILDPDSHLYTNMKEIRKARVLCLSVKNIHGKVQREGADEYPSVKRFISMFDGYEDVLEDIMLNMVFLSKLEFNGVTAENVARVQQNILRDIQDEKIRKCMPDFTDEYRFKHLMQFSKKYKTLWDKLARKLDMKKASDDIARGEGLPEILYQDWTTEELMLMLKLLVKDTEKNKKMDALIVFISSHGVVDKKGESLGIADCESEPLPVCEVLKPFNSKLIQENPDLFSIIFVNACRGKKNHEEEFVTVLVEEMGDNGNPSTTTNTAVQAAGNEEDHNNGVQTTGAAENKFGSTTPYHHSTGSTIPPESKQVQEETQAGENSLISGLQDTSISGVVNPMTPVSSDTRTTTNLGVAERETQRGATYSLGESLPKPPSFTTTPTILEPEPMCLQPTRSCPNNCLVAYSTTRGFKSGRDALIGSYFFEILIQRLIECKKGCVLLPFLTVLHNELSGDLEMPTFEHRLPSMPVLIGEDQTTETMDSSDDHTDQRKK